MTYDLYQLSKTRGKDGTLKLGISDEKRRQLAKKKKTSSDKRTVEDVFIESLVAASSCRHHIPRRHSSIPVWSSNTATHTRRPPRIPRMTTRHFTTEPSKRQTAALAVSDETTKEEYRNLVNTYDSPSDLWEQPVHVPQHFPLAPRLVIPPEKEDNPPFAPRVVLPPEDGEHAIQLKYLRSLLYRKPGRVSHSRLWNTFQSLRSPRLRYVADDDIRKAFRHLSWVEFPNAEGAMPRYFALLEECVGEQIPVTTGEWNSAISYAGRWVRHSTSAEVKGAVETWMRMERHGAMADNTTFNILFDVAVKAGRFALADTIFNELKMRDMPLNRYFRTSMIYYAGMRGDGDGVRKAFRDLVNAGEIVDTAIMNCVILSLVRAGEPAAAEHVFYKMKQLYEQKLGTEGPSSWQGKKELSILLHRTAMRLRREKEEHESSFFGGQYSAEERREEVQKVTPIKPDARTYRILIQHHAYSSGDLDRIRELLDEMKTDDMHVHGSVYVHLFRGFWQHGGFSYTSWNRENLEAFWDGFLADHSLGATRTPAELSEDAEQSEEDKAPYFTKALAHGVLRAFFKCAGRKKMLEVWEEIKAKWVDMEADDRRILQELVEHLVREDSVYI
ncbi:hypothetical protein LTR36_005203 [Oleoguttula mirabilis]|uniref:Pentatricopeptide repeat-containing protein n=1 Tax=Oleoguttula mirabilis TaxID=1507867 RepID=A0AAV9JXU8_9PEZI|nr:hypothetical protein LTR36_005203 [Oleoguttula mirabilis]